MWPSLTTERKGILRGAFFACPLSETRRAAKRVRLKRFACGVPAETAANRSVLLKMFRQCFEDGSKAGRNHSAPRPNTPETGGVCFCGGPREAGGFFARAGERTENFCEARAVAAMGARNGFRRGKKAEKRDMKKASRGGCLFVCLRRFDQNAAMMAPLYFSWRKSLTCWLWSAFTSFWISGRFSSPLRTATMFT